MIKAFCDECGVEIPDNLEFAVNCWQNDDNTYCGDCQAKFTKVQEWREEQYEKMIKQLDAETAVKRKQIFGETEKEDPMMQDIADFYDTIGTLPPKEKPCPPQ